MSYGTERGDTQSTCGDRNNGFVTLVNWSNFGSGPHTIRLLVDTVTMATAQFSVTTLGTDFLEDVTGSGSISLSDGKVVDVKWEEATQGFTITGYTQNGGRTSASPDTMLRDTLGTWHLTIEYQGTARLAEWMLLRQESLNGIPQITGTTTLSGAPGTVALLVAEQKDLHPEVA